MGGPGNDAGLNMSPTSSSGLGNTFVGSDAGETNGTGSENTLIGKSAGQNNTSSSNTMVGNQSGIGNTSGSLNSFFGTGSGSNSTGSGNVFLGRSSGSNTTESDKLYIENSNSSSPLIYGEFDTDLLRINGTLNINSAYSFPTSDGTINQILQTDGVGNVSWQDNTGAIQDQIADTDNDTKIQVEEGTDDDIIRFDMAGTEFLRLDNGRIEVLNTGGSVFIGENAGLNDDLNNNDNVFIGYESGKPNVDGYGNTACGTSSLKKIVTGDYNAAYGFEALRNNTGGYNTGVGPWALAGNTSGSNNVGLGRGANSTNTTGNKNIAIGSYSLEHNSGGSRNVAIGNESMAYVSGSENNNTAIGHEAGFGANGSNNIFLGYQAGTNQDYSNRLYIENSNSSTPLIYGEFDNDILRVNGTLNINSAFSFPTSDGTSNQVLQTDGSGSLSWTNNIGTDTDDQTLSLSGNNLTIVDGNTVDLSTIDTDTDDQTLSLSGNDLTIADGNTVDLSGIIPSSAIVNTSATNSEITGQVASINITGQLEVSGEVQTFGDVKLGATGDPSPPTITIGSDGTALTKIIKVDVVKDVGSISSNNVLNVTFDVPGAETGSSVIVSPSADLPGSVFIGQARVSADDTVLVRFLNEGSNDQDPNSMTYYITVIK